MSVTTSDGAGQSSAISLNPGIYSATVSLPTGFGLTEVSCSDADSVGSVSAKTATINLQPAEQVTCTFGSADSRTKTTQTIRRFLSRRADLLLNQGPDGDRQIDRLLNRGGNGSNSAGTGFAASRGSNRLPSTTAFKNDTSGLAGGGVPSAIATGSSGGLWAFDAPSGLGTQDRQGDNPGGAISTLPFAE